MTVVLDASAGVEITLSRKDAGKLTKVLEKATKVLSTDLYKAETANTLWKYCKAGLIDTNEMNRLHKFCLELVDDYRDISENIEESLHEGVRLNHPVYDLLYLTLARRNSATLLTQDKRLSNLAKKIGLKAVS